MFRGSLFEGIPKFHVILSQLGGVLRYLVKRTHCMTVWTYNIFTTSDQMWCKCVCKYCTSK